MDIKTTLCTLALCAGLALWLLWDLNFSLSIHYDWHNYLVDTKTGLKLKPRDVLDLGKIINYTPEYINKTNALERLYDLQFQSNLENPIIIEQSYSRKRDLELSGWPVANQSECLAQLEWIHEQLNSNGNESYQLMRGVRGLELTRMLDSFGRPESGFYSGTLTWVGSHKRCLASQLQGGKIRMRYCQARLRPKWWPERENVHPKSRIKMGICLPETCDSNSFQFASQRQAIDALIRLDLPEFFKQNLQFESMFCLPDERSPIRQLPTSGYIYLFLVGSWLVLIIMASILYEVRKFKERRRHELCTKNADSTMKFLAMLSVHNSIKSFKTSLFHEQLKREQQQSEVRVDLSSLSFVKFWLAILVVFAHSCYLTSVFTRSLGNRLDLSVSDAGRMILSLGRCVDTFFMIFGLLASYKLLRKFQLEKVDRLASPLTWIQFNWDVMLRVTPLFMLVYWYSRLVSPYTGSGPWWDYGLYRYTVKGSCMRDAWWKSIPYFGCIGEPPVVSCILSAWFIVSYSQIALILPLLTCVIYKLPSHLTRSMLLAFIGAISCVQIIVKMKRQVAFKDEAFTLYGGILVDIMEKFQSTGAMATIGRASCVSLGCYTGYLLRMYELGRIKQWPRWLTSKLVLLITITMHFIIIYLPLIGDRLSHLTTQQQHIATMNEFLSSYTITMILWPVINIIVTINAVTIYNRKALIRFLSHPVWYTASKLGLAIYLVHWEIMWVASTSYEHAPPMGFLADAMKLWAYGVFYSIILAFLLFILFEAPISELLKHWTSKLLTKLMMAPTNQSAKEEQKNARCELTTIK